MGNILSRKNSEFNTTDNVSRNSEQSYTYDNRDRLTSSGGKFDYETWNPFWNKRVNTYSSDFEYNITGKILRKNQENKGLIEDTGETVTIGETTYDWNYEYGGAQPNAVTKAGTRTFSYDLNGNMTAMMDSSASLNRTLLWDEENRLKKTTDTSTSLTSTGLSTGSAGTSGTNSIVTTYGYGADGMRAVKKGKYGTVQYVSENYVVRNKDLISKHVFAGNTRLVSNMVMREEKSGKMVSTEQGCYYYHADHLGSSSVVTDKDGKFYEQLEYFPYGETWVHNKAVAEQESTSYKFTGKELDPETGLYYFGARYYDGKLSRWTAADPALVKGSYFPKPKDFDTEHDYYWYFTHNETDKLPGMGGVFNSINLDGYQYAGQNPVKLVDPDGNAHFAHRPLGGGSAPWIPIGSKNPLDDYFNTEISHEHLFYDDGSNENIGFGPGGTFSENPEGKGYRSDMEYFDDGLMRAAVQKVEEGDYQLLWFGDKSKNNCQDWSDRVRGEYQKLYDNLDDSQKFRILEKKHMMEEQWKQEEESK